MILNFLECYLLFLEAIYFLGSFIIYMWRRAAHKHFLQQY